MAKSYWLWPTLVMENNLPSANIVEFNTRILARIPNNQWRDCPETAIIKDAFMDASCAWLNEASLQDVFEPFFTDLWLNVYQPGQFIPPHYHGNLELVNLYYLTDEDEETQLQLVPYFNQVMSRKAGHTAFVDPRGAIEIHETRQIQEFCPKQGKILTWPGHLQHWTMPTNRLRVIIGAHIGLRKL